MNEKLNQFLEQMRTEFPDTAVICIATNLKAVDMVLATNIENTKHASSFCIIAAEQFKKGK